MLRQKKTATPVSYFALLILFLFSANSSLAQTPQTPSEKPIEETTTPARVTSDPITVAPATAVTPDETTANKTSVESATVAEPAKNTTNVTPVTGPPPMQAQCKRNLKADVVAVAQPIFLNRLGAVMPGGMVFALKRDTVGGLGKQLRADKRPRPIVLRANVGDCIQITLTNNIPSANFTFPGTTYNTPEVSLHVQGMEWVTGPKDDGSFVGRNDSSLATASPSPAPPAGTTWPPQTQTYTLYAKEEGTYLVYSMGDTSSVGSQISQGLFGALNVQPADAEWYRSQVTQQDLKLASTGTTADGHPIINYNAVYPANATYPDGTPIPPNTPILNMLDSNLNIVHTDLTALITGPKAGRFTGSTANCDAGAPVPPAGVNPLFCKNPASPDRLQPYREITIIYHGALGSSLDGAFPGVATQAFPVLAANSPVRTTTVAGQDAFAINYGTGGIGAEIYANRIGVGPMGNCIDCKFEEFFLSAWSVGDPAMIVDRPANVSILNQAPPLASTPAAPAVPPPPPICTTAQYGDTTPATNPDPNCANAHVPGAPATPYSLSVLAKATRVYYPDDPSNVYHTYMNDHVKFRILHGGRDVSHVHHQHAHQWLQSPNSDQGSYLDSQMISPGASYTLEMVYNGSGNRNKTVGDSIFHCHFYPHFAAGMWAMWRVHDTFEAGSELKNGIPIKGTRALPDGEIAAGSPNVALVPMPTLAMAPMPSPVFIDNGQIVFGTPGPGADPLGTKVTSNPGYPFFIPGVAGARAPHPPLDFAPDGSGGFLDGGLPRHVVIGGTVAYESHDTKDWSKDLATIIANKLPETGTPVELVAMKFFGTRCYASFKPDGTPGSCPSSNSTPPQSTLLAPPTGFIVNGLPRKNAAGNVAEQLGATPGAPFADPAIDDNGNPVGTLRRYKGAAIQANVTFNKKKLGWHYPQQRMLALWQDASPTIQYTTTNGTQGRPPEPLFFRGNTGDIIEFWHTNLVPNYYNVDDFQVRTPTDILGQHIHLVKFDVTSSDGAGNGFNYEDGTFSPGEVQEIIRGINHSSFNGFKNFPNQPLTDPSSAAYKTKYAPPKEIWDCTANPNSIRCQPCPEWTSATSRPICMSWLGAQTTIQRWYVDPLVDNSDHDRTLRTVFTHDHFGPSTHQQAGLYAGLLIEPQGSTWTGNDGTPFGTRTDGGPTSWQARIITSNPSDSYREFMLEFQDLQLAYRSTSKANPSDDPKVGWIDNANAINPPCYTAVCTATPSLITTGVNLLPAGTQSVNYTNEPIAPRLGGSAAFPVPAGQPADKRTDLSYMFDNSVVKQINSILPPANQWAPDPMTPLMRAYQGDKVQLRMLVGAHVFQHQFNLQGPQWFSEPSWKNSGYRSAQPTGLSEHFELVFNVPSSSAPSVNRKCPDGQSNVNCVDYLYSPSFDESGISNGLWGIFRSYDPDAGANDPILKKVVPLPNNPIKPGVPVAYAPCPAGQQPKVFNITAIAAQSAVTGGAIVFNDRGTKLQNKLGIMYVRTEDLAGGKLNPAAPVEPLILRANAGDCIQVNLTNGIPQNSSILSTNFSLPQPFTGTVNPHLASSYVGLHPQLLSYDAASSSGLNVGWNREGIATADQTIPYGKSKTYTWYAGTIDRKADGTLNYTPVEFGALNLFPSDLFFQNPNGLYGSMVIEPAKATWQCGEENNLESCEPGTSSPKSRRSATVTLSDGTKFREFALMIGDSVAINGTNTGAVNYASEPWSFRYQNNITNDFSCMLSNQLAFGTTGQVGEPQTPILTALKGGAVRFRMTHPFGTGTSQVFSLHGHVWQRNPYITNGTQLGNNILSQWIGSRDNHGASDHFDMLIDKAGGEGTQPGDYLYSVFVPTQARDGAWGVFRVYDKLPDPNTQLPPVPTTNAACPAKVQPGYQPPVKLKDGTERFTRQPLPNMKKP
jgi:manganese oxidase